MHWTEPTEWKRVKDNAREIARTYHWRTLCVGSGVLAFAGCLCARLLVPETAAVLTWSRIAGIVAGTFVLPLSVFVGSLQTGSVVFRRKAVDVSDSFVHVWIPYEKVVRFGFERFAGKTYFVVRGIPRGKDEEIEVHVALTSKHSEADVKAYLIQRGMGSVISETRELQASPIRTTIPVVPHEAQLGVMACYIIAAVVVPLIFMRFVLDPRDWNSDLILLGFLVEFFIWDWLIRKGSGRKATDLVKGLPVRRVVVLGLPYMLTLWPNPAVVLAALLWGRVPMIAALCAAGVWQVAWLALVYGAGRFSVSNSKLHSN